MRHETKNQCHLDIHKALKSIFLNNNKKILQEKKVQTFNLLLTQVIPLNNISLNNRSIMCFQ